MYGCRRVDTGIRWDFGPMLEFNRVAYEWAM
ncbi:hypothetical protein EV132_13033 [Rhizobium sullae]|uniref:Uncharacterized protein n=1 Tax=Rhizobium sullae TaxID=50338 RepID=A0A4R3PRQ4_RHISU|nr:hypothetical protein EV132_13033 [Rhizobium sullae]